MAASRSWVVIDLRKSGKALNGAQIGYGPYADEAAAFEHYSNLRRNYGAQAAQIIEVRTLAEAPPYQKS